MEKQENIEACGASELDNRASSVLDALKQSSNKIPFEDMTKMEKRVALAKDVIASIKAEQYIAKHGTYFNAKGFYDYYSHDSKKTIFKDEVKCEVCAIGSLFMSNMKCNGLDKNIDQMRSIDDDNMVYSLSGIFSELEMRKLEYVFENLDMDDLFEDDETLEDDVLSFRNEYHNGDDNKLLIKMMENIVENNGNFIYKSIKI